MSTCPGFNLLTNRNTNTTRRNTTTISIHEDGAVVVRHLVLAAHNVTQRHDGGLVVGLLQLEDVHRAIGVIPVFHDSLDEHRHNNALGFVVLYERDGRIGHAPVFSVEGLSKFSKKDSVGISLS